eukprot:522086-Pelagomonas_calceolata.AAC.1
MKCLSCCNKCTARQSIWTPVISIDALKACALLEARFEGLFLPLSCAVNACCIKDTSRQLPMQCWTLVVTHVPATNLVMMKAWLPEIEIVPARANWALRRCLIHPLKPQKQHVHARDIARNAYHERVWYEMRAATLNLWDVAVQDQPYLPQTPTDYTALEATRHGGGGNGINVVTSTPSSVSNPIEIVAGSEALGKGTDAREYKKYLLFCCIVIRVAKQTNV